VRVYSVEEYYVSASQPTVAELLFPAVTVTVNFDLDLDLEV